MDKRMMNAWLQGQAQKQELTTTRMQQKRLGIDLNEQLSAEEEKYAKEHKSMLASMVKQYGKEKGTSVFYGKVRKAVKELKEGAVSDTITPGTKMAIDSAKQGLAKYGASKAGTDLIARKMAELAAEKPGTIGKMVAMPRTQSVGETPQMKTDSSLPTPEIGSEITPEAKERLKKLGY